MASGTAASSRDRTRTYRARMRAKGMKLVQFWVPDTASPAFRAEARGQSLAVANSPTEADDQAFVDYSRRSEGQCWCFWVRERRHDEGPAPEFAPAFLARVDD
ncbi:MAG TPA: antitoxin MazE family protein [Allosphingosinicella sp.]|nr:antitoxin MazE family protein [Allosphingosinicella sp.]